MPGQDGRTPEPEGVAAALAGDLDFQEAVAAALIETHGGDMRRLLRPAPPMPYGIKETTGRGEPELRLGGDLDVERPSLLVVAAQVERRAAEGPAAARVVIEVDGAACLDAPGIAGAPFATAHGVCMQVVGPGHHKVEVVNAPADPDGVDDGAALVRLAWFALDLSNGRPGG